MGKNKLLKETRNVELRNLERNDDNSQEMIVRGYASVFDSPTVLYEFDGVEYKEVIARGAFDGADFSDCCLKYNHNDAVPILARTRGGSLKTEVDELGLKFEAKLFDTGVARDVYTLVKEGCLDKCSFAFSIVESDYDRATHTRTITKIGKVFDVSIVDIPAYDDTSVEARSYFELEREKELSASEDELAIRRKRIMLRVK